MFLGYSLENWLELGEWYGLMIALGAFIFCMSAYLSNLMLKEEVNKDKLYKVKNNKNKKKQWFYDVA